MPNYRGRGLEDLMKLHSSRKRKKRQGRWGALGQALRARRGGRPMSQGRRQRPRGPRPAAMAGQMNGRAGQLGAPRQAPGPFGGPQQGSYGMQGLGMGNAAAAEATGGGMRAMMNNGGADLPPQDGNPYSPTGGQGFNLNNMLRGKRNRWS